MKKVKFSIMLIITIIIVSFKKDIRVEGRFFEIGENDLTTVINRGKPFYRVNKKVLKY